MSTEDDRCAKARRSQRIDDAFHKGDLEALRAALDDPAVVPNGPLPDAFGSCLVYAIYQPAALHPHPSITDYSDGLASRLSGQPTTSTCPTIILDRPLAM